MYEMYEELKTMNEEQLRKWNVPPIKSKEELDVIIKFLSERKQDYGTCVYAMSIASVATFNYMSYVVGSTGFQASCADLNFLTRVRGYTNGFKVIDFNNVIYPQSFNNSEKFPNAEDILLANLEPIALAVQKLINKHKENKNYVSPEVLKHWRMIMDLAKKNPEIVKKMAIEEL